MENSRRIYFIVYFEVLDLSYVSIDQAFVSFELFTCNINGVDLLNTKSAVLYSRYWRQRIDRYSSNRTEKVNHSNSY